MRLGSILALTCSVAGCGPVVIPGDGGEGTSTGSGGTTATTVSTTVSTGTTSSTTAPPSSSTTTSADASDDFDDGIRWDCAPAPPGHQPRCSFVPDMPGGGGDSVCDPQPVLDTIAWVSFDAGAQPAEPLANPYVYECTIATWSEAAGVVWLTLACADGGHLLELGSSTGIYFDSTGDFVVSVIYSDSTFEGGDQLVTLRRADGELVLAGATTPWAPDDPSIPAELFAPLDVELLPDVCGVEDPWDGSFVAPCFTVQRQALRFSLDGQSIDVYDHGVDQLSPYMLAVETAELRHDVTCTDTSDTWYSWLAVPPIPD